MMLVITAFAALITFTLLASLLGWRSHLKNSGGDI